ncbi:MAG: hypothetical protein SFV54_19850 [Bryobacteraceae bacterium]|nr:hypothetical protein [Bryobacteraceae bacterium]
MAYSIDMRKSARRHLRAAEVLYKQSTVGDQPGCKTVAGYLFGIAGELAVKELMRESGVRPFADAQRSDDPFYAHFPQLKRLLATAAGRRAGELRRIADDPRLFANWDVAMRYAPSTDIREAWIDAWRSSARELIERMDTV